RGFLTQEARQPLFELLVQIQRAVQEPAARAAATIALQRRFRRGQHLRVMRQAQVVVGAHHHLALAVDDDLGVVRRFDRQEIRIVPGCLNLPGTRESMALVEEAQCDSPSYSQPAARYHAAVSASPWGNGVRASNPGSRRADSVSHNQPGASSSLA